MTTTGVIIQPSDTMSTRPLRKLGLLACRTIFLNASPTRLIELALARHEGSLADNGAFTCDTGAFTGRSPKDKFIVRDAQTADTVDWGEVNRPFAADAFGRLRDRMLEFLEGREVFVRYVYAGASAQYRMPVTIVTTKAWHSLFCCNLFICPTADELAQFDADWSVLCVPEFEADPATDGTRQANFTIVDMSRKQILIGGTAYAGEIKKGVFTVLNYRLPVEYGVLPMHCSANIGLNSSTGDTESALFFGLSGTGKTTLSADPDRQLIGDDEHGWADSQIFNFEGGCYAKVINLSADYEPQIHGAIRYGTVVENTRFWPGTQQINYADGSVTENTRAAYPLSAIPNAVLPSVGPEPRHIFFLTADAFGVLPPLARLTVEQALFYFLSGYTAKVAGTEMGVTEPVVTFSACFGAAFLPLKPAVYAELLGERLRRSGATVWLINTGWTGGPFGVGQRMPIRHTRAMLRAVLHGGLTNARFTPHDVFGIAVPDHCPGVPDDVLQPVRTWPDPVAYRDQAERLLDAFQTNAARFTVSPTPA